MIVNRGTLKNSSKIQIQQLTISVLQTASASRGRTRNFVTF